MQVRIHPCTVTNKDNETLQLEHETSLCLRFSCILKVLKVYAQVYAHRTTTHVMSFMFARIKYT